MDNIHEKLFVNRFVSPRYARLNGEGVVQAPMMPHLIDKGIPTLHLLAQILSDKYIDLLHLYRQTKRYDRERARIPGTTLDDWLLQSVQLTEVIYTKIKEKVLQRHYLMSDETTIKVLQTKKKGSTHLEYY